LIDQIASLEKAGRLENTGPPGPSGQAEPMDERPDGGPDEGRRPTIDSVASAAAVSRQTVSNVINAPHRVGEQTRQRVERAIAEAGYRPLKTAQALRTRRSNLIAVGITYAGGTRNLLIEGFLHVLTEEAQRRGYRILLVTGSDDASEIKAYNELLTDYDIDALVFTATHRGDERIPWLLSKGTRFVTFGRPWGTKAAHPWVDVDGAGGVREATEHLIEVGHERIAFIGWPAGSGVGEDRLSGWEQACRTAGLPRRDLSRRTDDGLEQGRQACASLLDSPKPPTAIVCVSDTLAVGAWVEVTARGGRPGRDVAIIGFDDSPTASMIGLSSVAQPLAAAAAVCVDCVQTLNRTTGTSSTAPLQVLLTPKLIVRESG
jgi:DNA-binding LacI/PurR family transcriptional regulator